MTSKESVYGVAKSINNTIPDANGNVNVICEDTTLNDLEVLNIIKKFFFIEAYSNKRLNADFCKITSIEDKEANIDNSALSFIDRDSLKILKKWLRRVKNDK